MRYIVKKPKQNGQIKKAVKKKAAAKEPEKKPVEKSPEQDQAKEPEKKEGDLKLHKAESVNPIPQMQKAKRHITFCVIVREQDADKLQEICLPSILEHTNNIMIIEDGSSKIIRDICDYEDIRYITVTPEKPCKDMGYLKNEALRFCNTEFIFFVNPREKVEIPEDFIPMFEQANFPDETIIFNVAVRNYFPGRQQDTVESCIYKVTELSLKFEGRIFENVVNSIQEYVREFPNSYVLNISNIRKHYYIEDPQEYKNLLEDNIRTLEFEVETAKGQDEINKYIQLFALYSELEEPEKAISMAKELLVLNIDDNVRIHFTQEIAKTYFNLHKKTKIINFNYLSMAVEYASKALELYPELPDCIIIMAENHFAYAEDFLFKNRIQEAVGQYKKSIAAYGDLVQVLKRQSQQKQREN